MIRLLLVTPAVALLAGAGLASYELARADAGVTAAMTEIGTWSFDGARPERGTWASVDAELAMAERRVPSDPTTQEMLGVLGSLRSDDPGLMAAGVGHLVRALELRPSSPYTWAHLAEAMYRQGVPGRNLQIAFHRAAELGPSEPGVQRLVAHYGLAVWDEIDAPTRGAIDRIVAAGFRRNPLEMLQISERRGRLDIACRHLEGNTRMPDARWAEMCQAGRQP